MRDLKMIQSTFYLSTYMLTILIMSTNSCNRCFTKSCFRSFNHICQTLLKMHFSASYLTNLVMSVSEFLYAVCDHEKWQKKNGRGEKRKSGRDPEGEEKREEDEDEDKMMMMIMTMMLNLMKTMKRRERQEK